VAEIHPTRIPGRWRDACALTITRTLLDRTCPWMAAYFDLDDGTLRYVAAEPRAVAALTGMHVNAIALPARAA
jgi:hypothetical protein